jgi:pyrimidine operon attenuation protein / uracil phosphoribosyltransferase
MIQQCLLDSEAMNLTLNRLAFELIENHDYFNDTVMLGLQPRGAFLAQRLHRIITEKKSGTGLQIGLLDATFHRDDYRHRDQPLIPSPTRIDFVIENKKVILVDDVLYTGRTIRAGLDAMLTFGRPHTVELLVLVDRRYSRHLPIQPDYVGSVVDTINSEKVKVCWRETDGEDKVWLITDKTEWKQ